jgi:hypothetical protein
MGRAQRQVEVQSPAAFDMMTPTAMPALDSGMAVRDDSDGTPSFTPGAATANMVIRTATASVQVDSLEPAVAALRELAMRIE